jgi:putative ABC transport system permease protein
MNRLALRNLFRHRVRSIITLSAIAFSTIVLVVASGFVERIFYDLRVATIETGLGHVQVTKQGWFENGTANPYAYFLPGNAPELQKLAELPHVKAIGQRLQFNGLINANEASLSFVALGVEPDREAIVSRNLTFLSGSNLDRADANEVVVGEGLAANLGVKVGDRVVLLVNSASGSVRATEVTVRGIFSTQVRAFDEVAIRTPLAIARKLMRTDGAHVWVVSLDDEKWVDETMARVKALVDPARFDVVSWIDLADVYTKTKTFMSGQLGVMQFFVATIIVLGVSNMLIMNVLERTGEIGTLMALGARRRKVTTLFLVESMYLGLIGGAIGIVLAILAAWVISAIGVPMPPPPGRTAAYVGKVLVDFPILGSAFAITVLTTVLAGLYPARKASRLVIVDALRYNR